jgi:hypothetical protein
MSDDARRTAGFAFARSLADPGFRGEFHKYGLTAVHHVVVALPGERWEAVRHRVTSRCKPPAIVVIPGRDEHRFHILVLDAEPGRHPSPSIDRLALPSEANIDELYERLEQMERTDSGGAPMALSLRTN